MHSRCDYFYSSLLIQVPKLKIFHYFILQNLTLEGATLCETCTVNIQELKQSNEVFSDEVRTKVSNNTTSYGEWTSSCQAEVNSLDTYVVEFVDEEIKDDNPTGKY